MDSNSLEVVHQKQDQKKELPQSQIQPQGIPFVPPSISSSPLIKQHHSRSLVFEKDEKILKMIVNCWRTVYLLSAKI